MFPLRLLVFALILHNATAEKEKKVIDNSSSQTDSKKCGYENQIENISVAKDYIDRFLKTVICELFLRRRQVLDTISVNNPNNSSFNGKIKQLECELDVWGKNDY